MHIEECNISEIFELSMVGCYLQDPDKTSQGKRKEKPNKNMG